MSRWAILPLALGLASCGTYLPQLTSHDVLPLEVLIAKIDCEFQRAVWTQKLLKPGAFVGWQGQYNVTLKSNEIGSAKALTNTFPFLPSKKLTINATLGGGETTTANRTALMKFNLAFDDVRNEPTCDVVRRESLHPLIAGRIGFEEWMDKAFEAAGPRRISSLGHTFEFSIDVNANAGAGFVIAPAPTIGINPTATIDRLDDGSVDVVIAKPAVDPLPGVITGLTKEDKQLAVELQQLIDELKRQIGERETALAKSAVASKLSIMSSQTIQELSPSDDVKLKAFGLNPTEVAQLKNDDALKKANDADRQKILQYSAQKAAIGPKVTAVTTKYRVLPAELNPQIANTMQQLTIERLNNNLRVPSS